jgi:diguanylate cyclase (GGDEF)-like protein
MEEVQETRIETVLLRQAAEQSFRTLLGGPLAALVSYLTLRSSAVEASQIIWALTAGLVTFSVALWCRSNLRKDSLTRWRYRAFAGLAACSMVAMPVAFHPAPNSRQAALEVVSATLSTIVLMIMTAADRPMSYATLLISISVALFNLSALAGLPLFLIALSAIAVFLALSPLIETVHQPLRKNIVLLFANEQLVTDLQRANVGLSTQVITDSLTGLGNRAALDKALESKREVGILYLDVDHFKTVNDTRGHAAGDELLLRIAGTLRRCTRDNDFVARLGGDEFVVLLESAPIALISEIAERIRAAVQSEFVEHGISVSIGATVCDLIDETGVRALARADRNLYQAKQAGRNQVLVH